jgi:energy-converting hydrogenase A subunit M
MKSALKEYTETILSIITDAMDNDLSLQWLKDKIEDEISLEYSEKEKQQIIDAYKVGKFEAKLPIEEQTTGKQYYNETFKQD